MRPILFLTVCYLFLAVPVLVQARELSHSHTIEIEVECVETARAIISELNGYNLQSDVQFAHEQNSRWRSFSSAQATITRRVDGWAFRHVQEVLRGLGNVTFERENARNLSAEILDINTRMAVLSQEMERLTLMMAASDSLDVLIAVNDRLNTVSRERDSLIGRRNVLITQAESPIISITLFEPHRASPSPEPLTFGERVSQSFTRSWNNTRWYGGNILEASARASVPLFIWAVITAIFGMIVRTAAKRSLEKKPQTISITEKRKEEKNDEK